jgi:hypothetical protein
MIYPEEKVTLPTIFMCACGATQAAAEAYFPASKYSNLNSKELLENSMVSQVSKPDSTGFLNPRKGFALLVGINNYGNDNNLEGCLNDVNSVKNFLIFNGWDIKRIMILTDKQANKTRVLQELQRLVEHCNKDDSLWLYFSGHGSWTLCNDGIGWECCICCTNCNQDWDNGVITRTQFNTALERPAGNLQVTLDCCFSGGMTPTYRSWKQLPAEVDEILYGRLSRERLSYGVRALPGPEWVTLASACNRLNMSHQQSLNHIKDGTFESREVLNGPLHIRV